MNFEWDERKNESNIDKHGFDFADAYRIFDLPIVIELDERYDYGEDRLIGLLPMSFLQKPNCGCLLLH